MMFVDVLKRDKSPEAMELASAMRARRLGFNLSQQALAMSSGVPLATLKKFERTGQISLTSFLSLCDALDLGPRFDNLIPPAPPASLEEVEGKAPRQARKRASPIRGQE